jgi:hypothetical protein
MSAGLVLRGGSELSPGDFNSPQTGGLLTGIMGGSVADPSAGGPSAADPNAGGQGSYVEETIVK